MATMIVPVGFLLGPRFTAPTIVADSYDVRVADQVHTLTSDEHTVWSLSHGFPEQVGEKRPSRPLVEAQATQLGVGDSQVVFQRLVNSGLIVPVTVRRQLQDFAESHRAFPLVMGLGNSADDISQFLIGRPDEPYARVAEEVFHLWSYLPLFGSISDAVAHVGMERAVPGVASGAAAGALLEAFLQALPVLLAQNCIYIDRN